MRRKNKRIVNIILVIFFILIISISVAYAVLKENIKISGIVNLEEKDENGQITVTYIIKNSWNLNGKYYHLVEMTLHNGTDKSLNGWKVSIKAPSNANLENYYGTEAFIEENNIHFKHTPYNSNVESKEKVVFEFQVSTTDVNYKPSDIIINDSGSNLPEFPEDGIKIAEVTYKQEQSWKVENRNYYQYTVIVKNTGNLSINLWQFDIGFKGNSKIEQIWNAEYVQESKRFIISNTSYNGKIDVDKEISFGIIISSNMNRLDLEISNVVVE